VSTQDGWSVAVDRDGNILVAGSFYGSIDFGDGPLTSGGGADIFVLKLDPNGDHLWSRRIGGGDGQTGQSIAVDPEGNALIAGSFLNTIRLGDDVLKSSGRSTLFLAKLSPDGSPRWGRSFGAAGQAGHRVATDGEGNVLVTGTFTEAVDFGGGRIESAGSSDIFLAKLSPDGRHLWSKGFGDVSYQRGQGLAVDAQGNVFVTGSFEGTIDLGGGPMTSAGPTDIFLAKLDPAGRHIWSKRFGEADGQGGQSIAADAKGNVVMAGYFSGSISFGGRPLFSRGPYTFFLAKLDPSGAHLWSGAYGETSGPYAESVAIDSAGNIVMTGPFQGSIDFGGGLLTSAGQNDIIVAKLDEDGSHLWSARYGDSGDEYGQSVAVDSEGAMIVVGAFSGSLDLGGGPLTSRGGYDIFVVKLA
jgi:hypothetical protein